MEKLTQNQIDKLNEYQESGRFHPYTCLNDGDEKHILYEFNKMFPKGNYEKYIKSQKEKGNTYPEIIFTQTNLIATEDGWICPVCDYKQKYVNEI